MFNLIWTSEIKLPTLLPWPWLIWPLFTFVFQVHRYFNHLPEDKIPFIGSAGEQYRMKQLIWQLPPHDSDMRYCRQLSSDEKREHINFNNQRKKEALGRGTVRQLPLTLKTADCTKVGVRNTSGDYFNQRTCYQCNSPSLNITSHIMFI